MNTNKIPHSTMQAPDAADAEARKEKEGIAWCERTSRKLNAKRSDFQPKRRWRYVDRQ